MTTRELDALQNETCVGEFPRLSRFYGFSPVELAELPRWMRELYLHAIPQLQAEEQLLSFQASDFPHMDQKDRSKLHRQIMGLAARRDIPEGEQVDTRTQEGRDTIGSLGFKVVVDPGKKVKGA